MEFTAAQSSPVPADSRSNLRAFIAAKASGRRKMSAAAQVIRGSNEWNLLQKYPEPAFRFWWAFFSEPSPRKFALPAIQADRSH